MLWYRQIRRSFFIKAPKPCIAESGLRYIICCIGAWLSLVTLGCLYDYATSPGPTVDITKTTESRPFADIYYPVRELKNVDRVIQQISGPSLDDRSKDYKRILLWTPFYNNKWNIPEGLSIFQQLQCRTQQCYITDNRSTLDSSDAVIVHGRDVTNPTQLPRYRLGHQRWIFYLLESPHHIGKINLDKFNGLFNWTSTYSSESDIPIPYGEYVPYNSPLPNNINHGLGLHTSNNKHNFATRKTRLVAWFVTNCKASNHREEFVDALKQYVQVDVYGICDRLKCRNRTLCLDMLKKKYKFYLAFENSNCREYITEKFWYNALDNRIVPIVFGPSKRDYERLAPPNSFIHIDDFPSVRELASYLHLLHNNDNLYNQYFNWIYLGQAKTFVNFGVSNSPYWCDLCQALHDESRPASVHWNLSTWWSVEHQCNRHIT